jgi:hypothetical protein
MKDWKRFRIILYYIATLALQFPQSFVLLSASFKAKKLVATPATKDVNTIHHEGILLVVMLYVFVISNCHLQWERVEDYYTLCSSKN